MASSVSRIKACYTIRVMNTEPSDLDPLAALAEPVRRRLYEWVVAQGVAVDRDAAAAGVGIGRPLAAFHLDRLAKVGLLDVEFRRRSGRTGPGAGRPAKFYRRPVDRDLSVSLPPRRYGLAAEILADAVERDRGATAAVLAAAREHGVSLADEATRAEAGADRTDATATGEPGLADRREALLALLRGHGYEPFVEPDGTVRLRNCPFHGLVADHRALTCSMNLAMLGAAVEELGDVGLVATPRPVEGFCCVAFVPREASGT